MSFDFVTRVPTAAEHRLLAESVGWHDAGRAASLYERLGFAAHPGMTGMFRVVQESAVARG